MSRARDVASLLNSDSKIEREKFEDTRVVGRRNLITNGAMQVAQRGTSGSITTTNTYLSVDRFFAAFANKDQYVGTLSQVSEAPDGFSNSVKVTGTTVENTLAASELFTIRQRIEAQNLQHLQYGTSSAKSLTLSFWVRSSETGTYAVAFYQNDDTRILTKTYTIDSADTWEYKTITIDGDTTGVIDNDTGQGMEISWVLATGSNYTGTASTTWSAYANAKFAEGHTANGLATETGATFHLTGVQLELGDTATPFEHRSFAEELALCQRYFYKVDNNEGGVATRFGFGMANTTTQAFVTIPIQTTFRTTPSVTYTGDINLSDTGAATVVTALSLQSVTSNTRAVNLELTASGLVADRPYFLEGSAGVGESISMDAEL